MARAGGDKRGNTRDRARRKAWLLRTFGNGVLCRCSHCGAVLDVATLEADRIEPGGSYCHANIQPACRDCNLRRSNNPAWSRFPAQAAPLPAEAGAYLDGAAAEAEPEPVPF